MAILGAGAWGTTLAAHVAGGGHSTVLWDFDPAVVREIESKHVNSRSMPKRRLDKSIRATGDLAELARSAHTLVLAIPSTVAREVLVALGPHVRADHLVIHTIKGLERNTGARITEIIRDETCCKRFGVLSGPNLAPEVLAEQPSAAVIASRYPEVIATAQRFFVRPFFRVYGSADVVGVEMGAAIKNVLAIAMGFVAGMGLGQNTRSLIVTRGLAEMIRIGTRMGGEAATFNGISGIGDLIGSGMSRESANYAVGELIAQGRNLGQAMREVEHFAEGVPTTEALHALLERVRVDAPLSQAVYEVLYAGAAPSELLKRLMARPPTMENDAHPLA
ncbi:MAG: NAD(P)H-dependent glycerol-3-phosphate dehydrogenase [bacterium]